MALSAVYLTTATFTTSAALYTVPTSTAATYSYTRDLVVTNSGTPTVFLAFGTGSTAATTLISFAVPSGGSLILTQCSVPASSILWGISASGTGQVSIGFATNVEYN